MPASWPQRGPGRCPRSCIAEPSDTVLRLFGNADRGERREPVFGHRLQFDGAGDRYRSGTCWEKAAGPQSVCMTWRSGSRCRRLNEPYAPTEQGDDRICHEQNPVTFSTGCIIGFSLLQDIHATGRRRLFARVRRRIEVPNQSGYLAWDRLFQNVGIEMRNASRLRRNSSATSSTF